MVFQNVSEKVLAIGLIRPISTLIVLQRTFD
jgi:hypothetical protein